MAHSPDVPVRDDLLSGRLSVEERRSVSEELRYPGYQMHHRVRPVLLPIVNRGFSDPEKVGNFFLENLEFKPPLSDMVANRDERFWEF